MTLYHLDYVHIVKFIGTETVETRRNTTFTLRITREKYISSEIQIKTRLVIYKNK